MAANAERLDAAIDFTRDFEYDYFGFKTLEKSLASYISNSKEYHKTHIETITHISTFLLDKCVFSVIQ